MTMTGYCFLCRHNPRNQNRLDLDNLTSYCNGLAVKSEQEEDLEVAIEMVEDNQFQEEYSLLAICRYLKLHLGQENTEQFGRNWGSVTLCGTCGQVVDHLSKLCNELEVLQMKVDEGLRRFHQILREAQEEELVEEAMTEKLRLELNRKCEIKLKCVVPVVQIPAVSSATTVQTIPPRPQAPPPIFEPINLPSNSSSRQCNQCGQLFHKSSIARHRKQNCPFRPQILETPEDEDNAQDELLIQFQEEPEGLSQPLISPPSLISTSNIQVSIPTPITLPSSSKVKRKGKIVRCDQCGKLVHQKSLGRHKQIYCSNVPQVRHPAKKPESKKACDYCGKMVMAKSLKRHMNAICELGPRIKLSFYNTACSCDICGKKYEHKASLHRHKRDVHLEQSTNLNREVLEEGEDEATNESKVVSEFVKVEMTYPKMEFLPE